MTPTDVPADIAPEPDGFVIRVDFDRGAPHPERVFRAIDGIITALQGLDRTLLDSISAEIQTALVLEDVRAGSIWIRLKNVLHTVDEGGLAKGDWKAVLGRYLVAGRNALIAFGEAEERTGVRPAFGELRRHFFELARGTDVKPMGDYDPPSARGIVDSAVKIDKAVKQLAPRDRVAIESDGRTIDLRPGIDWTPDLARDLTTREVIDMPQAQMILVVKRPDYLSNAQWDFRHGRQTIHAKIEDQNWLARFHARQVVIRPGDALRCVVASSVTYGFDNDPSSESHTVVRVLEVLEDEARREVPRPTQGDILDPPEADDAAQAEEH